MMRMKLHFAFFALALMSAHQVVAQASQPTEPSSAQGTPSAEPETIVGTVRDVNQGKVSGATVALQGPVPSDQRTAVTNGDGYFEFQDVKPGVAYQVIVSADGFAVWTSSPITLEAGQGQALAVRLEIEAQDTAITVNPEQEAVAQVKIEEQQRVLGVIPNFFEVFCPNPPPLTAKLKLRLAFKAATDPFTFAGVAFLTAPSQLSKNPMYGGGMQGFAQRFGATYTNQFTSIVVGGGVLPALLRQDPRYYYQGKGGFKARAMHAILDPFITRSDDGRRQPNYSSLGGDLVSAALSNAYYPPSNRGAGLMLQTFAIDTAVHIGIRMFQEFVFHPSKAGECP